MSEANEIIVTIVHVRDAGLCSRGARAWFARHNLDFRDFLTKGLPISQIDALNDALGNKVAAAARDDAEGRI